MRQLSKVLTGEFWFLSLLVLLCSSSPAVDDGYTFGNTQDFTSSWEPPGKKDIVVRVNTPDGQSICVKMSGRSQNGNFNLGPGSFHMQLPNGSTAARNKVGRYAFAEIAAIVRNSLIGQGIVSPNGFINVSDDQHRSEMEGRPGYNTNNGFSIGPDGLKRTPQDPKKKEERRKNRDKKRKGTGGNIDPDCIETPSPKPARPNCRRVAGAAAGTAALLGANYLLCQYPAWDPEPESPGNCWQSMVQGGNDIQGEIEQDRLDRMRGKQPASYWERLLDSFIIVAEHMQ